MSDSDVVKPENVSLETIRKVYDMMISYDEQIVKIADENISIQEKSAKAKKLKDDADELQKAQVKVLEDYDIPKEWLELVIENTITVKFNDASAVNPYELTEWQKLKFTADTNYELKTKYKQYCTTIRELFELMMKNMETHANVYISVATGMNAAGMALQELLADRDFSKLEELDNKLAFRRFYFPGGVPTLMTEHINDSEHWDLRTMEKYINEAKQYGFHKHFLIPTGKKYTKLAHCSFKDAKQKLSSCVDWTEAKVISGGVCSVSDITSIVAGLIYFGKEEVYVEYAKEPEDAEQIRDLAENLPDFEKAINQLGESIGQTPDEFLTLNVGYYAYDDSLAFDSTELAGEIAKYEAKYKEFKAKLWSLLADAGMIQICANRVNAMGNNLNITQSLECMQSANEEHNKESGSSGSNNGSGSGGDKDDDTDDVDDDIGDIDEPKDEPDEGEEKRYDILGGKTISEYYEENKTKIIIAIVIVVALLVGIIILIIRSKNNDDDYYGDYGYDEFITGSNVPLIVRVI